MTEESDPLRELEAAEASALQTQRVVLQQFRSAYALCNRALRLYAQAMSQRAEVRNEDLPARAHRVLLPRLADDLRTVWLVAGGGYWLQAMTLAGSALEVAATVGFLAFKRERAEKWLHWHTYEKTPWAVSQLIEGAVAHWKGQADPKLAKDFKTWYTIFCWAKHANPTLQTRVLGALTPADHVIDVTPEVVPGSNVRLWLTLYGSLQLSMLAVAALMAEDDAAPDSVVDAIKAYFDAMTDVAHGGGWRLTSA
jgi:hypothetical protein